jgi:hypothetical protein
MAILELFNLSPKFPGPVWINSHWVILDKVAGLVGLSSLHSLVFRLGRWDAAQLSRIFASYSLGIKRLTTFAAC